MSDPDRAAQRTLDYYRLNAEVFATAPATTTSARTSMPFCVTFRRRRRCVFSISAVGPDAISRR